MFVLCFAAFKAANGYVESGRIHLRHHAGKLEPWGEPVVELLEEESHCSDIPSVTENECLTKPGCMWLEMDVKNLCLPCVYQGVDIPCVPIGAVYASKKVKQCEMNCPHKKILTKESACTEEGPITYSQCNAKGLASLAKCMWTSYKDAEGNSKSMCGQCSTVAGAGNVPCTEPGMLGPEPGSTVMMCISMCDQKPIPFHVTPCDNAWEPVPCTRANRTQRCKDSKCMLIKASKLTCPGGAAKNECQCAPKERFGPIGVPPVPAVPPMPPMKPMPLRALGIPTTKDTPNYFAVPVQKPFGVEQYREAAQVAAKAAGWPDDVPLPPDAPVVPFGYPPVEGPTLPPNMKVLYGPPPEGIPGMPGPFSPFGLGTVPPPPKASFLEDNNNNDTFLSRKKDKRK